MAWNYRIVARLDGTFGLHEVYYADDKKTEIAMTSTPVHFATDTEEGPEGIIASLERALKDAKNLPIFEEPEVWPSKKLAVK